MWSCGWKKCFAFEFVIYFLKKSLILLSQDLLIQKKGWLEQENILENEEQYEIVNLCSFLNEIFKYKIFTWYKSSGCNNDYLEKLPQCATYEFDAVNSEHLTLFLAYICSYGTLKHIIFFFSFIFKK